MPKAPINKGEDTRKRILQAAYDLFLKNGFAATSMRQVASASGLTVGGIYAHFDGKEDLWVEVFDAYHPYHDLIPIFMAAEGETVDQLYRNAAFLFVREMNRRADIFNLMFIELVEFQGKHIPQLAMKILPHFHGIGLKYLADTGSFRKITPATLARAFMGLFFSYYVTDRFIPPMVRQTIDAEKALNEFVDIFLFGVLSEDDPVRRRNG